jgi:hypothetical protein
MKDQCCNRAKKCCKKTHNDHKHHKCHEKKKCCHKVLEKVERIDDTTVGTNEICHETLQIIKDIQSNLAPLIDPASGCVVSSQAVIDAINILSDTVFTVCPQWGFFGRLFTGNVFVPSDGDNNRYAQWQKWDDVSVEEQMVIINDARETLQNLEIEGMTEQERRGLVTLGVTVVYYFISPRTMANSNASGWTSTGFYESMVGIFLNNFGRLGSNSFAEFFDLQLTIDAWDNFADSMYEFIDYLQRRMAEDTVWNLIDVDGYREKMCPQVATIRPTALAPFTGEPLLATAEAAYDKVEVAIQSMVDFLAIDGPYYTKAKLLRGPEHPGLAAPNANPDMKNIDYPFDLETMAATVFSPSEVHALGLEQVDMIESEMVQVINESIIPEDPVANWTELIEKFRNDPLFNDKFNEEITVAERLRKTQADIYEAYSSSILAFQNFPSAPVEVNLRFGFGAQTYGRATVQPDGTKSVILSNGRFNQNTLSNTNPIDYNEIIRANKSNDSSITYHEAFPGHHEQIGIQNETACSLGSAPVWGSSEGWALYAEKVAANDMKLALVDPKAAEEGVPSRPYRRINYLDNRLLRAVRLVVDTGFHDLGWSRQQVVDYMLGNTLVTDGVVQSETDRYSVFPGQACGYLIGALALDRQRKRAEEILGELFSLPEYHDVVLRFIVPPEISLIYVTDFYISSKLNGTFDSLWPSITPQPYKPPLTAAETSTSGPVSLARGVSKSVSKGSKKNTPFQVISPPF